MMFGDGLCRDAVAKEGEVDLFFHCLFLLTNFKGDKSKQV